MYNDRCENVEVKRRIPSLFFISSSYHKLLHICYIFSINIYISINYKSVDYVTVFACAPYMTDYSLSFFTWRIDALTLIGCLLFLGVVGKSSQIGFFANDST